MLWNIIIEKFWRGLVNWKIITIKSEGLFPLKANQIFEVKYKTKLNNDPLFMCHFYLWRIVVKLLGTPTIWFKLLEFKANVSVNRKPFWLSPRTDQLWFLATRWSYSHEIFRKEDKNCVVKFFEFSFPYLWLNSS